MFVLRSSIPLQVSKKVFGIINKRSGVNKHWREREGGGVVRGSWKKKLKINDRVGGGGVCLALKSNINKIKMFGRPCQIKAKELKIQT